MMKGVNIKCGGMGKPRILIIGTGGTIASVASSENGSLTPEIGVEKLKESLINQRNNESLEIELIQLMNKDSTNVGPSDWDKLISTINENINKYDGIVVLHGTDTMAYSSSALSFVFRNISKPIVFTGSMLSAEEKNSDAPKNFNDALYVASHGDIYKGVLVVFGGKVIPGNIATKIDTDDFEAFGTKVHTDLGIVGLYDILRMEQGQEIYVEPIRKQNFDPNVLVIHLTPPGPSDETLKAIAGAVDGLVLEVFGSGGLPDSMLGTVSEIASKIPVVLVTQVPNGEIDLSKYKVGEDAKKTGIIDGGSLTLEAAVAKLEYILPRTKDLGQIKNFMLMNVCGEFQSTRVAEVNTSHNSESLVSIRKSEVQKSVA